jgi:hypothetical protein
VILVPRPDVVEADGTPLLVAMTESERRSLDTADGVRLSTVDSPLDGVERTVLLALEGGRVASALPIPSLSWAEGVIRARRVRVLTNDSVTVDLPVR